MPAPSLGVGGRSHMSHAPPHLGRVFTNRNQSPSVGMLMHAPAPISCVRVFMHGHHNPWRERAFVHAPCPPWFRRCSRMSTVPPWLRKVFRYVHEPAPQCGRGFTHVPSPLRLWRGSPVHSTTSQQGSSDATIKSDISWTAVFTFTAEEACIS